MTKSPNSFFCYYFTFILLLCVVICKSQTQKELLETLKREKVTIEYLANFENINFKLKAGNKDFNPKDNSNFRTIKFDRLVSVEEVDSFFKQARVNVSSIYPYNVFNIDKDESDLIKFLGLDNFYFMDNPHMEAIYTPTKVNFLDGSSVNASEYEISHETIQKKHGVTDEDGYVDVVFDKLSSIEKLIWDQSNTFKHYFAINSSKPVASLDYEVQFIIPKSETFSLSKTNKIAHTNFGEIKLLEINNASASLLIPSQLKKRFEVYAIYKDGRVMKQLSQNSNTVYSDEQKKGFADLLQIYELAEAEVTRKTIQDIDQLTKFIKTKFPFSTTNYFEPTNYYFEFDFAGPIDHLKIKVLNLEEKPEVFNVSVSLRNDEKEFILSRDLDSDLYGILDVKGDWVVKPFLTEYVREMNKYFFRDQIDYGVTSDEKSYDRVYWFDRQNMTLKLVDYIPESLELYDDKYCIVEKGINGKEGVVNGFTGEIVVPLIYYNVLYKDGKWVAKTEDYKETIYSLQGKKL